MQILVRAPVFPTEEKNRVANALSNLFPESIFTSTQENELIWLEFETTSRSLLNTLRNMIHENRIIDAARRILEKEWTGTRTSIHFDKQVAYKCKLRIAEQSDNPPLGSIEVNLALKHETEFYDFLSWFTPPTKDGRIMKS
ncbi:MAG: RNA-binding domain-containing protein [Candidatus Thorarchaeota archaeon]